MDVNFLVEQLIRVLVLLFVDTLAFSIQALLVFALLVVNIFLETTVHLQSGVESIFYRVIGSTWHVLGDQRPLLTMFKIQIHQLLIFFKRPFVTGNVWVEVVVPSLSALLANSAGQH